MKLLVEHPSNIVYLVWEMPVEACEGSVLLALVLDEEGTLLNTELLQIPLKIDDKMIDDIHQTVYSRQQTNDDS